MEEELGCKNSQSLLKTYYSEASIYSTVNVNKRRNQLPSFIINKHIGIKLGL